MGNNPELHPILDRYNQAAPIEFPIKHPNAEVITITELNVICKKCEQATTALRGDVTIHANCTELDMGGVCEACKVITWSRTRVYAKHLLAWRDEGIVEIPITSPKWRNWFNKLLGKFRKISK